MSNNVWVICKERVSNMRQGWVIRISYSIYRTYIADYQTISGNPWRFRASRHLSRRSSDRARRRSNAKTRALGVLRKKENPTPPALPPCPAPPWPAAGAARRRPTTYWALCDSLKSQEMKKRKTKKEKRKREPWYCFHKKVPTDWRFENFYECPARQNVDVYV